MKDPEGNTIVYTCGQKVKSKWAAIPSWVVWHTYNRTLNGWPPTNNGTVYTFALVGNDGYGGSLNVTYTLNVDNKSNSGLGMALMGLMASASVIGCIVFVIHVFTIFISKKEMAELGLDRKDFIKTIKKQRK